MQNPDIIEGVEMRSQFTGKFGVDLNCGRYCTEAAVKWWKGQLGWDLGPDIFHLLPEPKSRWGFNVGWSPGEEGSGFTEKIHKPGALKDWAAAIQRHGPLIVAGDLGEVSATLGFYVGHYILIVGVDIPNDQVICKDPLKAEAGSIRYSFDWIDSRIERVYAVDLGKLQAHKR